MLRYKKVTYMHVNSASYQWVGGNHLHDSYSKDIHAKHPFIAYTCPYRHSLFATLTVDPKSLTIHVEGERASGWAHRRPNSARTRTPHLPTGTVYRPYPRSPGQTNRKMIGAWPRTFSPTDLPLPWKHRDDFLQLETPPGEHLRGVFGHAVLWHLFVGG
ncbi:MAG: hypothetical protein Ct9H300mP1_28620 [Planctomycetaceae bacterium]|nr:MAG: hypothetical protein Ct9H300mP1_28620 [Planctomycetaceae bacterium]